MRLKILLPLIFSVVLVSQNTWSAVTPYPIAEMISRVDAITRSWLTLSAQVRFEFQSEAKSIGNCQGELKYHRLDEMIYLTCFNDDKELLFAFKTADSDFELYVPAQNSHFSGNIFDLEEAPDIDSHLSPLALYRALKPMVIQLDKIRIESWHNNRLRLNVFNNTLTGNYLARQVLITREGYVPKEVYFDFDEYPHTTIERKNYKEMNGSQKYGPVYPHKIVVETSDRGNPKLFKKTVMHFKSVSPELLEQTAFAFEISEDVEVVEISADTLGKNSHSAPPKQSAAPVSDNADTAAPDAHTPAA